MFTIELALKHTAVPLSIQKKTEDDANGTYHRVVEAMRSGNDPILELTCDQQPHKKVTLLTSELAAVQVYEKTSTATASGRPPGFFAVGAE